MNLSADFRLLAWLRSGNRRKKVLAYLNQQTKALTPSEIRKGLNLHLVKVSVSLRELKERGLIKLLNPKDRYDRLYQITRKGKQVNKKFPNTTGTMPQPFFIHNQGIQNKCSTERGTKKDIEWHL